MTAIAKRIAKLEGNARRPSGFGSLVNMPMDLIPISRRLEALQFFGALGEEGNPQLNPRHIGWLAGTETLDHALAAHALEIGTEADGDESEFRTLSRWLMDH